MFDPWADESKAQREREGSHAKGSARRETTRTSEVAVASSHATPIAHSHGQQDEEDGVMTSAAPLATTLKKLAASPTRVVPPPLPGQGAARGCGKGSSVIEEIAFS